MPLYEYKCEGCGVTFEKVFPIGQAPKEVVHECEDPEFVDDLPRAKRIYSIAGLVFKGPGFHKTDYGPKTDSKG